MELKEICARIDHTILKPACTGEDVYQLILTAERAYNYGDNKQKLKYVVQEARKLLPNWLQVVLSDYILERTVEAWFKGVKDLLDDGKVNGSQK